jgi:hypothetical protein
VCQEDDVLHLCEFFTVSYDLGVVCIVYHVVLRDKRDERFAFPRSRVIALFLFGGQVV